MSPKVSICRSTQRVKPSVSVDSDLASAPMSTLAWAAAAGAQPASFVILAGWFEAAAGGCLSASDRAPGCPAWQYPAAAPIVAIMPVRHLTCFRPPQLLPDIGEAHNPAVLGGYGAQPYLTRSHAY